MSSSWKREYNNALGKMKQLLFERENGMVFYPSPFYDPRKHLSSYSLEAGLYWPKIEEISQKKRIPLLINVASSSGIDTTNYRIEISLAEFGGKLVASDYNHSCSFLSASRLGKNSLTCKHVYRALLEADKICEERGLSYVPSMFMPDKEILDDFNKNEKKRMRAVDKLEYSFELIERFSPEELYGLDRLNQRINCLENNKKIKIQ